ncbi:MAG: DUF3078 domain-containing protein [Bacteroidales bacterium]|nr:DUF3078 domain-containing protein [Bacteroidales bacterium]MDT8430527.1 DUF3078 domain-containing protein [Bacteroidales bacterium]
MKRIVSILTLALLATGLSAQEPADTLWKYNGVISLNFSQMALSNWAAGGEQSISGNGRVTLAANYLSKDAKVAWANELILGYGLLQQGDDAARKSDDKIDFSSKFGYKAGGNWKYSSLLSFRSQFTEGYANPGDENRTVISNFLAPAYLNLSFGMDYKPSETFAILLAPVTGKMTFVMDDGLSAAGAFGVDQGATSRAEFGGFVKISWSTDLMKNVKLNTKLDLFSNYLENPQYVDVNFDLLLSMKVNDYISASFITQLIYDYDIKFDITDEAGTVIGEEDRIQLKELFGVGLTYSF